jgi:hypothetical protein
MEWQCVHWTWTALSKLKRLSRTWHCNSAKNIGLTNLTSLLTTARKKFQAAMPVLDFFHSRRKNVQNLIQFDRFEKLALFANMAQSFSRPH